MDFSEIDKKIAALARREQMDMLQWEQSFSLAEKAAEIIQDVLKKNVAELQKRDIRYTISGRIPYISVNFSYGDKTVTASIVSLNNDFILSVQKGVHRVYSCDLRIDATTTCKMIDDRFTEILELLIG